jgi:16S rRNA (guanine1207-N2)-methyltransferase
MKQLNRDERELLLETLLQELDLKKAKKTLRVDPGTAEATSSDTIWHRLAHKNQPASAWIPRGPFDRIFIRIPQERETIFMLCHAAASELTSEGEVILYGMNDEGMRSVEEKLESIFEVVETILTKRHARIVRAQHIKKGVALKTRLEDWAAHVTLTIGDQTLSLLSYPGTFAHGHIDPGTRLLLKHLPTLEPTSRVLDFGAGIGTISAVLYSQEPGVSVDLLDVNAVALAAAIKNIPHARTFISDGLGAVKEFTYDFIVSNPPVHLQREQTLEILRSFLQAGKSLLSLYGEIRFVVQQTTPIKPLLKSLDVSGHELATDGTYTVWQIKNRL